MPDDTLSVFADVIASTTNPGELLHAGSPLHIASEQVGARRMDVFYAPFEHVERKARLVIVGLTPGRHQGVSALDACARALRAGLDEAEVLRISKTAASFSGPMRSNLVRMLDAIGIADALGLLSTAELWGEASELAHFASLVRNPVFVDGRNWSGSPDPVGTTLLRRWSAAWTGRELRELTPELIIPLGPAATRGLDHFVSTGAIDERRILRAMPHPSGANAERVACFLGTKKPDYASAKTDGHALVAARERLRSQVGELTQRPAAAVNHSLTAPVLGPGL